MLIIVNNNMLSMRLQNNFNSIRSNNSMDDDDNVCVFVWMWCVTRITKLINVFL